MKNQFIKTSDASTAKSLRNAGLIELAKEGDKWDFVNEKDKLKFEVDDLDGCHVSNILRF